MLTSHWCLEVPGRDAWCLKVPGGACCLLFPTAHCTVVSTVPAVQWCVVPGRGCVLPTVAVAHCMVVPADGHCLIVPVPGWGTCCLEEKHGAHQCLLLSATAPWYLLVPGASWHPAVPSARRSVPVPGAYQCPPVLCSAQPCVGSTNILEILPQQQQ